ncbi:hypothetical protein MNBD_GAMMA08-2528 [hydrothermal vent metagenome]|uniref:Outer membrane efflux protein n=1 Tax=hydrothermal vent metagenome TaxID=652676 RepID=A0A3B0XQQ3_9ZZZZ
MLITICRFIVIINLLFSVSVAQAETMNIQQVLQRVIDHYPAIKAAAFQVEKARQENIKVENQLSWILNSNAGYNRSVSLFGTPTDRYDLGGNLNRSLDNGGVLDVNANVTRDDATTTFGPTTPNPLTKSRLDVNYRHRFEKGAGNPLYAEGLQAAEAGEKIAVSDKLSLYDQLASQVIEIYLAVAATQARIKNIDKTIARTQRLKKYIQKEFQLGLTEEKDVLQVDARLSINRADKKSLQVIWNQQLISLNRLMRRQWDKPMTPNIEIDRLQNKNYEDVYAQSLQHSPELKRIEARIQLAESDIRTSRDQRKDNLDLVMFLGNELNQGDFPNGKLDESEVVGGVSIEFNRGLDKSGFDAQIRQAHFDKGLALQDKKQVLEDLQYNVASLLTEIDSSELALSAFKESVNAEQEKLDEAIERYKDGRIETDRIIDFESELAVAELSADLQAIELIRRYHQLNLVRGGIWKNIFLPEFSFDEATIENKKNNEKGIQ